MNSSPPPNVGHIDWHDLTVENADEVRDFYKEVVGWTVSNVSMGDYNDYCMNAPTDDSPVAGVCHALGVNADVPPMWVMYVTVEDIKVSLDKCEQLGGKRITKLRSSPQGSYCVIADPAGAVLALFQPVG